MNRGQSLEEEVSEEKASLEQSLFMESFFSKALAFPFFVGDLEQCLDNENEGAAAIGRVVSIAASTKVDGRSLRLTTLSTPIFCVLSCGRDHTISYNRKKYTRTWRLA